VTIDRADQARELIERRTVEAAASKRAIVHMYNAIAPLFRRIVFNMSREEVKQLP
jgi:2-isopropylmalate synthase